MLWGVICIAAVFLMLLLCRSSYEKRQLGVTRYRIASSRVKSPCRFVFLSDLHEAEFGRDNERLLCRLRELGPDAVLIGGDMVICPKKRPWKKRLSPAKTVNSTKFLNILTAEFPVYFAMGNHEQRLFERAAAGETGAEAESFFTALKRCRVLSDRTERFRDILLSGVTLPKECFRNRLLHGVYPLSVSELQESLALPKEQEKSFSIGLVHSPMYGRTALQAGVSLVLSGHYHGGTIRLPLLGGLMTPQFQFFAKNAGGKLDFPEGELIVSRGLGTHSINIRLNNQPELILLEIMPAETEHGEKE